MNPNGGTAAVTEEEEEMEGGIGFEIDSMKTNDWKGVRIASEIRSGARRAAAFSPRFPNTCAQKYVYYFRPAGCE